MMSVPKLRFKEFDGEWLSSNLGEISDIKTGPFGSTLHQEDYVDIGTPIITVEHLGEIEITNQNLPLVSDADKIRLKSYLLKTGDLAFSRVGSVDRCAIVTEKENGWLFSGRILRVRPNNELIDSKNLMYALKTEDAQYRIRSVAVGQTMPSLNTEILKNFPIILSNSKKEQTKIASFLSVVDEKISQLTKKHKLLSQYKQGMMQKLFSQQIRFKADDGSEFGEWEETVFEKIGTFLKGKGISKADIIEDGFTPCIRYGELYTHYGEVISKVISATNLEIENLILSKANDVLIPASGETQIDIATASCVLQADVALSGDLNIFRTKENGIFLSYLIRSHLKMQIAQLAQGNSVVHLYSSQLKGVPLNLPCLEEQTQIANILSSIDQKIEVVAQQIEQAKQWKKGLLQQMFV